MVKMFRLYCVEMCTGVENDFVIILIQIHTFVNFDSEDSMSIRPN